MLLGFMDTNTERLIKYIRKEDVVLFIGSGFSLKAGAPSVQNIINTILEEGGDTFAKDNLGKPLIDVSEAFVEQCNSRNDLISLLGKLFQFTVGDTKDQSLLRNIPHFRTIFTTNYDTLLEASFPENERSVITSNAGCSYACDKRIRIYKIHGDITTLNNPDGIIITNSDYKHYFNPGKNYDLIWNLLKQTFVEKHVLFIGYSLEDDNILEIIKNVRKCIRDNMKDTFLVAPNMSTSRRNQLKANKISYIDSYANDLLNDILSSIKDNIVDDFKHRKVSKETFDRFCEINDIQTTIRTTDNENLIEKVYVRNGQKKDEKIVLTVPAEVNDDLLHLSFNDMFRIPGTSLKLPAIKIASDKMIDFSYSINGIRFNSKSDISSLCIAPSYDNKTVKFKVPAINFVESVILVHYKVNRVIHMDIETPICFIKLVINNLNQDQVDFQTSIEYKESYKNNNDALKWIECLIALSHQGQIAFIDSIELTVRNTDPNSILQLEKVRDYYLLINKIESYPKNFFESYDQYSESNYLNALYLYLFLSGENYKIDQNGHPQLKLTIDTSVNEGKLINITELKDKNVILYSTPKGDITLNNKKFYIPYIIYGFMDCRATNITTIDDTNYDVVMENAEKNYMIWCTDTGPRQVESKLNIVNNQRKIITIG